MSSSSSSPHSCCRFRVDILFTKRCVFIKRFKRRNPTLYSISIYPMLFTPGTCCCNVFQPIITKHTFQIFDLSEVQVQPRSLNNYTRLRTCLHSVKLRRISEFTIFKNLALLISNGRPNDDPH